MVKFVTFPRTFWRANAMKCSVVRKLNQLLRCPHRRNAQSRLRVFVIKPGFPKKSRLYTQSLLYLSSSKTYSRQAFLGYWEIKNCESANYYATKLRASLYSSKFWTLFQGFTFDKSLFPPLTLSHSSKCLCTKARCPLSPPPLPCCAEREKEWLTRFSSQPL